MGSWLGEREVSLHVESGAHQEELRPVCGELDYLLHGLTLVVLLLH
jgi:hypothetical protein